jgi:hypothetical protein
VYRSVFAKSTSFEGANTSNKLAISAKLAHVYPFIASIAQPLAHYCLTILVNLHYQT